MLKNENIICISSIDWDFIWQGHQEIMSALAENGNRILFIENTGVRPIGIRDFSRISTRIKNWYSGIKGIRKIKENLYVYSPIVLPFPYLRLAVHINSHFILSILEKWAKATNFNNPIIWTFLPTPLTLNIIDNTAHKLLIYYCIDNFTASSSMAKKIRNSEIRLIKISDLVFVTSHELHNHSTSYNKNTYIFPFGVNYEKFEKVRLGTDYLPDEIANLRRPLIGYVGGIHKWIDLGLIKEVAIARPGYSFVFVGPVQTDISALSQIKNLYFLGQKDHEKLPLFIKNFDICLIPYLITDYTKNVYPTKLNEYLAMGKPVIATRLPEIIKFNKINEDIIFVADDHGKFINLIDKIISKPDSTREQMRIEVAKKNSWHNRILDMSFLIERAISEKKNLSFDWQVSFAKLFKKVKRKTFKVAFVFLCFYLLIFYTPVIWLLAKPLKITQKPQNADVIVVFAGGAGESGNAGQGYEERVNRAVELYKAGFANKMIFSSGNKYFYEEATVMKALAISLKVPEEAIILEDKATSTYENVKYSEKIIQKLSLHKILLVSSPYHMRRALLVFKHNAKDIEVLCIPVENSLFYQPPNMTPQGKGSLKKINFSQARAILHEYLGIIYYYLKGWI